MVVWHRYGKSHVHARRGNGRATPADGRARSKASEPGRSRGHQGLRRPRRQAQRRRAGASAQGLRHGRPGHSASTRRRGGCGAPRDPKRATKWRPAARASDSVIHLDTSLLVDALSGSRRSARALRKTIERGERVTLSALVLYEWRRGPRVPEELTGEGIAGGVVSERVERRIRMAGSRPCGRALSRDRTAPRARDRPRDRRVRARPRRGVLDAQPPGFPRCPGAHALRRLSPHRSINVSSRAGRRGR